MIRKPGVRATLVAVVTVVAVVAVAALGSVSASPIPLEDVLPADSFAVLVVDDVPRLRAAWPASPFGRLWNDPEMSRFLGPLQDAMGMDHWDEMITGATGQDVESLLEVFLGPAAFVVAQLPEDLDDGSEAFPSHAFLALVAPGERLDALLAASRRLHHHEMEDGVELREKDVDYRGVALHLQETVTGDDSEDLGGWAVVDDMLVMGQPRQLLQDLVGNLLDGGAESALASVEGFRRARAGSAHPDLTLYVTFAPLHEALRESLTAEAGEDEAQTPAVDPEAILSALALDTVEALYGTLHLSDQGSRIDFGLLYQGNRGLVRLLAYGPGPLPLPGMVPGDAVEASVSRFSIPAMWGAAREILATASPELAATVDGTLQQLALTTGADLEQTLIGSLGDTIVTAKFLKETKDGVTGTSTATLEDVLLIAVKDAVALETGLSALLQLIGDDTGIDVMDHGGVLVRSGALPFEDEDEAGGQAEGAAAENRWALAVTDQFLVFSRTSPEAVERMIDRLSAGGEDSLWNRADVRRALKAVPREASAIAIIDLPRALTALFSALGHLEDFGEWDWEDTVHLEDAPDARSLEKYFGLAVGHVVKDGRSLTGSMTVRAPN